MSLLTKNVFLTGGAAGLGKAYTRHLLQAGARVVFGDINDGTGKATEAEFAEKFGAENVFFVHFDCTNKQQFEEVFQKAVEKLGYVDLMVNNAGVMNESIWELMISLNYAAVVRGTFLAVEHMRKDKGGKGGRIINVSSGFGLDTSCFTPVYTGTKHAVRAFTTSLVMEPNQAQLGIEYGVMCPGVTNTPLLAGLNETSARHFDILSQFDGPVSEVDRVAEGFMKLATLETMNGAIIYTDVDEMEFYSVEKQKISWPPAPASKKESA